jgi:hypothetical protein
MFPYTLRPRSVAPAFGVCTLLWLAGSASAQVGGSVAAPQLALGDHWQYRVTDNLRRGAVSQLDAEVISVSGRAARIRFNQAGASGRAEWIDEVDGQGGLSAGSLNAEPARPFNLPVQLLAFPLEKGKTWRRVIDTLRIDTGLKDQILIFGRVGGPAVTTVPAGRFDTVFVYRTLQLDDAEFWRTRTSRSDSIWYAPAAKAPVRETREATYTEKGGRTTPVRTESTLRELVSFQPGGK